MLDAKVAEYRAWSIGKPIATGRLVKYTGVQFAGAIDVPADELEEEVTGLVCEGFYVNWREHAGRTYLCAWEYPGPEPEWHLVFAEKDLADI
jgi:hypothetical protein